MNLQRWCHNKCPDVMTWVVLLYLLGWRNHATTNSVWYWDQLPAATYPKHILCIQGNWGCSHKVYWRVSWDLSSCYYIVNSFASIKSIYMMILSMCISDYLCRNTLLYTFLIRVFHTFMSFLNFRFVKERWFVVYGVEKNVSWEFLISWNNVMK